MTTIPARVVDALAARYRVEREIGAGGMATVYLAEDLKHHRRIALKVLKPELAAILGAERFLKEIEVTANLQHPNILPLYDSGEAGGHLYYVMPFIEGEALRDRLSREKQLPVDEALRIADSVAAALQFAHERGVVHRDIKPENILLQSGQALVADFGIALAVSQAGGARLTETGLSLGTPHYMSPEQATGDRDIDARSDIYGLGCVLYEMLAGEPPHLGNTAQAVVAKILTDDPEPVRKRRKTVPLHVDAVVQKALAKLPADRFASAAELRSTMANPSFTLPVTGERGPAAFLRRVPLGIAGATAVVALAVGALALRREGRPATPLGPVVRFEITPPDSDGVVQRTDVSPDGSRILLEQRGTDGQVRVYIRDLCTLGTTLVQLADPNPRWAFFSPDGRELAFVSTTRLNVFTGKLRVAPVGGGPVRTIADSAIAKSGWGDDGYLYYSATTAGAAPPQIVRVASAGGVPDTVLASDSVAFYVPTPLPGSRGLIMIANSKERQSVAVLELRTRAWRALAPSGLWLAYVHPGYLLFDRGRFLMAARFDPERLELIGDPVPVLEVPAAQFGAFSIRGGTLTYLAGLWSWHNVAVLVDRRGNRRPLENLPPSQEYGYPAVSPDGRKIALRVTPAGGGNPQMDLWVYEMPRGPLTRLTSDAGQDDDPSWTPNGKRILFNSERGGDNALWWKPWDGGGEAEKVLDRRPSIWRTDWLPDGRRFLFYETEANGRENIGMATVGEPDSTRMLLTGSHNDPAVSPDGRWLAYQSNESGRPEIYLRPLEGAASRRQISRDGGISPVWARSGRELFFQSAAGDSLYAARLDTGHDGALLGLGALFGLRQGNLGFDVLPGDSLFVLPEPTGPGGRRGQPVVVVHNFVAELEARLGAPTK